MKVFDEIIKHFEEKGIYIKDIKETEKSYVFNIIIKFNGTEYIEDLEIAKYTGFGENKRDFITEENKQFIINAIEYNVHNALDRYLKEG